jgi:hypothetical protein
MVDHPLQPDDALIRPWRTATLVAVAVAAVELLLLVIVVGALIAKPESSGGRGAAPASKAANPGKKSAGAAATKRREAKAPAVKPTPIAKPELARRQVSVLVLNGNGRQGAAAAAASKVRGRGYEIGGVANAPSHDYARSMIMFRTGYAGEAQRLARDLGIELVGPLDGIRPGQLNGAHAVLILGK